MAILQVVDDDKGIKSHPSREIQNLMMPLQLRNEWWCGVDTGSREGVRASTGTYHSGLEQIGQQRLFKM
jgi:hypothetical protein